MFKENEMELLRPPETPVEQKEEPPAEVNMTEEMESGWGIKLNQVVRIDDILYRIIDIRAASVTLIAMEVSRLQIFAVPADYLFRRLEDGRACLEDYRTRPQPMELLKNEEKDVMAVKQRALERCLEKIYPFYEDLQTGRCKPEIEELMRELNVSKPTACRLLRRYLQSGRDMESLMDMRKGWGNREKTTGDAVCGAGFKDGSRSTLKNTPELYGIYDKYFSLYEKEAYRGMTMKECYLRMLSDHFSYIDRQNGMEKKLVDRLERPSYERMRYYFHKKVSSQQFQAIKMGAREARNNNRLLPGNTKRGAYPGKILEIDEVEMDMALVSTADSLQNIGTPVMYCAVDVFSHCIVAVNVAFANNSFEGFCGLMETLLEDHKVQTEPYGVSIPAELFPSEFLPDSVRCDHGSEYVSKNFERAMRELNIDINLVPPGAGSLKPLVEQSFHQFQERLRTSAVGNGVRLKRVDSKHYDQSVLNIHDIRKIAYLYVQYHNMHLMQDYPFSKDMMENGIQPTPAAIWAYGIQHYTQPRKVTDANRDRFRFALMCEDRRFVISLRGIQHKNLFYYKKTAWLDEEMYAAGRKRVEAKGIRYDPRSVNNIYMMREGLLEAIPLSEFRGENASFQGMSWKELDDWLKRKEEAIDSYRETDLAARVALSDSIRDVVQTARSSQERGKHKKHNIREARKQERERLRAEDMLGKELQAGGRNMLSADDLFAIPENEVPSSWEDDPSNVSEVALEIDSDETDDFSDLFPDKWERGD